jgi:hypothetical protein
LRRPRILSAVERFNTLRATDAESAVEKLDGYVSPLRRW